MGKGMLRNWQRPGAGRGGGNGDREMGRRAMVRGKRGREEGRGQQGGVEGARRGRISQMDMMECLGGHRL